MPFARSGEVDIYYESHGSGKAVVFVHGGNGNTLSWIHQVPHFSKRYRCITVDLRCFKQSRCDIELYHPKYYVGDMLAVMDAAAVDKAAFVCQSLGAWAGLPMAVRHPQRVWALAINGSPTPVYSERNWALLESSAKVSVAVQQGKLPNARSTGISERFMTDHPELTFLYEAIARLNGPRRTLTMLDEELKIMPHHFTGYRVPTLLMGGQHDHFLTPDHHLHIASLVPGAQTHTFQESGHSAYFEEPAEFNRVVGEFLDACAGR